MSTKYPGGIVKATTTPPTGGYYGSAPGIWTMEQAAYWIKQGQWPLARYSGSGIYSWGYNAQGQLGLGNTTYYSFPVHVGTLTTWLNIAGGGYHSLATKTDGTLWSWGSNQFGQLGLGNTTNYSSPKQVGSNATWSKIAGGANATLAILS